MDEITTAAISDEQAFRRSLEASPMGVHLYQLTADNRLVFTGANPAADRILGVDNQQFIGMTIEEAFPPLAQTEIPWRYRAAAKDGIPWSTDQITYRDGEISGAFRVVAFQIGPGRMAAQFLDITDQKKTESRLKLFEEAVGSSTIAIGMSTPEGRHFYQNRAFDELFGEVGPDPSSVYVVRTVAEEVFGRLMSGRSFEGELKMHCRGRVRDIFLRAYPSFDEDGQIRALVGIHSDVTEQKQFLEIAQMNQKMEALGVMAGGIAHDFNNLLGGLFGYVNLALNAQEEGRCDGDHLKKALSVMERARALAGQLLTFSKGGEPVRKVQAVQPFLESNVRFALSGADVSCSFEFESNLWNARFDEHQVGQVVNNLVINAVQAMAGGGALRVRAGNVTLAEGTVEGLSPGPYSKWLFEDSGTGIPSELVSRIFDPFVSNRPGGHGLGLAVSHSIVRRHGGSISVASTGPGGTSFCVMLPAFPGADWKQPVETEIHHAGQGRVLIMDDEPVLREVLGEFLGGMGYEVLETSRGEDAVAQFLSAQAAQRPFCAVILDLTVRGGMGGKEAGLAIRAADAHVPMFVVSGYGEDGVMADPGKSGFTDSLRKPFDLPALAALLNRHLSQ